MPNASVAKRMKGACESKAAIPSDHDIPKHHDIRC
jgi:hypothetical protein